MIIFTGIFPMFTKYKKHVHHNAHYKIDIKYAT